MLCMRLHQYQFHLMWTKAESCQMHSPKLWPYLHRLCSPPKSEHSTWQPGLQFRWWYHRIHRDKPATQSPRWLEYVHSLLKEPCNLRLSYTQFYLSLTEYRYLNLLGSRNMAGLVLPQKEHMLVRSTNSRVFVNLYKMSWHFCSTVKRLQICTKEMLPASVSLSYWPNI